ncbi:hypothetical protein L0U85_03455 [Glycomyces sp. L485]|uniref:hypothetical protein n=1 Tax=Glycomyces sp. L485 TaxID=2909235 RepID=UPI001F4A867F|nr:hypothetical protein [Glycomyces sp. L485]MCH7229918.1 hypothetical protein [Glycomyces sp. L485]
MTHETIPGGHAGDLRPLDAADLVADALPLEVVDIDGRPITFIWYYRSGVDRLTLVSDSGRGGVVENLDSMKPQLREDRDWKEWFSANNRVERTLAAAAEQWRHRGEIVADRALAGGEGS